MKEKEANRAQFISLLSDAKLTPRSTFPLFRSRHCRDPRFKSVPIVKDQVSVFIKSQKFLNQKSARSLRSTRWVHVSRQIKCTLL